MSIPLETDRCTGVAAVISLDELVPEGVARVLAEVRLRLVLVTSFAEAARHQPAVVLVNVMGLGPSTEWPRRLGEIIRDSADAAGAQSMGMLEAGHSNRLAPRWTPAGKSPLVIIDPNVPWNAVGWAGCGYEGRVRADLVEEVLPEMLQRLTGIKTPSGSR